MSFDISQFLTYGTCAAVIALFVYRLVKLYWARDSRNSEAYKSILTSYQSSFGKIIPGKTLKSADEYFTIDVQHTFFRIALHP